MSNIMDAAQPGLYGQNPEKSTNISDKILDSLSLAVQTLRAEKKITLQKLRITVENLVKLWDLMEASEKRRPNLQKLQVFLVHLRKILFLSCSLLKLLKRSELWLREMVRRLFEEWPYMQELYTKLLRQRPQQN